MENLDAINAKIFEITLLIEEKYPEVYKFLPEMPVTIPIDNNPEISCKTLTAHYNSLKQLLDKYLLEHPELE